MLTADGDDETKNESSKRVILLPHITINEFKERYNIIQPKKTDLIFPSIDPSHMIKRDFKPLLRDLGLSKKIRIYDFRHSCASILLESDNIKMKDISEQLGHSSISITMDTCGHLLRPDKVVREPDKIFAENS